MGQMELLVDELTTDLLGGGDPRDGDAGQGVEGQVLPGRPRQ